MSAVEDQILELQSLEKLRVLNKWSEDDKAYKQVKKQVDKKWAKFWKSPMNRAKEDAKEKDTFLWEDVKTKKCATFEAAKKFLPEVFKEKDSKWQQGSSASGHQTKWPPRTGTPGLYKWRRFDSAHTYARVVQVDDKMVFQKGTKVEKPTAEEEEEAEEHGEEEAEEEAEANGDGDEEEEEEAEGGRLFSNPCTSFCVTDLPMHPMHHSHAAEAPPAAKPGRGAKRSRRGR